jgi:hypothetical protein
VCAAAKSQRIFTEDRLASRGRMVHHSIAVAITSFLRDFVERRQCEVLRKPFHTLSPNKGERMSGREILAATRVPCP